MNPDLDRLQPYPFEKLAQLKAGITPPGELEAITLAIGEPKHHPPKFVADELLSHLHGLATYPSTKGSLGLRKSITTWLIKRFQLPPASLDPEQNVLPVSGTREALFAFAQCVIDPQQQAYVLMPNPFYQIYEGAALMAGAQPYFLNTTEATGLAPDFDQVSSDVWDKCQLLYICTPGNPTGAVINNNTLQQLINLAERHNFIIASDECYSEIYFDEHQPPTGLLEAAAAMGNTDYRRCIAFHSLSKRSNLPGMRSGFVAGDAAIIQRFFQYRTYHGCAMPPYTQAASIKAWNDEVHVQHNRQYYQEKFRAVLDILSPVMDVGQPDAGFYLWPQTPVDDTVFSRELYARHNVTVLPGSYLSREVKGINPGRNHVRIALVAELDECIVAANRISSLCQAL